MRFIITTLLLALLASGSYGQDEQPELSPLARRMVVNDPTLTMRDYGMLYFLYLVDNELFDSDNYCTSEQLIEEVIADEQFVRVVDLVNEYDDVSFRLNLGMDIIHLVYDNDGDIEQTRFFLDKIMKLLKMVEEDDVTSSEEELIQSIEEILSYFLQMLFQGAVSFDEMREGLFGVQE